MRGRKRHLYEEHGNVFFITFTVAGFVPVLEISAYRDIVIDALKHYQTTGALVIVAYVIMPNHVHLIVSGCDGKSIPKYIGGIKRFTSRRITEFLEEAGQSTLLEKVRIAASKEPAGDCRIWKPRYDCFVINRPETLSQKIAYIHNNPVKAGLAADATEWRHSSARDYAGMAGTGLIVDHDWQSLGYDNIRSGRDS